MRILHTSDWHLGRIFHGVHLTADQAYLLEGFYYLVKETKPEVILIAGDVYDRSVPPPEAVALLDEILSRILLDFGVPIILIAGNHDSPERLNFGQRLLQHQGLHVIGQPTRNTKPIRLSDDFGPVVFFPLPFTEPVVVQERFANSAAHSHETALQVCMQQLDTQTQPGIRRVALAHAFVTGGTKSESERPFSLGGAGTVSWQIFQDFHYTALGHLHKPQTIGQDRIRYSGSLMKYSFSEADQPKSVTLVELDQEGNIGCLEEFFLVPKRDVRCLEGYLEEILTSSDRAGHREDYLAITLKDQGPILDVMGKLRRVYPNVLHIERPSLSVSSSRFKIDSETAEKPHNLDHGDLFQAFFQQITGAPLTPNQAKEYANTVDSVYRQEREVDA